MSNERTITLAAHFVHAELVDTGPVDAGLVSDGLIPANSPTSEVHISGTKAGLTLLRDCLTDFLSGGDIMPGASCGFSGAGIVNWRFKCIAREFKVPAVVKVDGPITEQPIKHTLVEQPVCHLCNGTGKVWAFHDGPMEVCPCVEGPPSAPTMLTPELLDEMFIKMFDGKIKRPNIETLVYELDNAARLYRITNEDGCHDEHLAIIAKQRLELIDAHNEAVKSSPSTKETDHGSASPE